MHYTVSTQGNSPIEIGATGLADIIQCLRTLLCTIQGTVFLDRKLGLSVDMIDEPVTDLSKIHQFVYEAIEEYEPRVEVLGVKQKFDNEEGKAFFEVLLDIDEKYLRG